jgi:hypothetical protein
MLVYGDHSEFAVPRELLEQIREQLAIVSSMRPGIERHAKLVGALIEAGQLLQGAADADAPAGELSAFVQELAEAVVRSWDGGFADIGKLPALPAMELPGRVELRLPEGFAFYAVYPEGYIEAARKLSLAGPPRVIGIRSIGTTLGAVTAAALRAPLPVSVRPFGDPFARQVKLPPGLIEADAHYVVVDEGPGLSGSSFGAVADWLEERGVPLERIAFLPSHGGDLGPHSSTAHRERWKQAQRVAAEFEPDFLARLFGPLEEFSTGHPWERRKYLATHDGTRVLLKFAGLGAIGEQKLEMARVLHAAGFTPEPLGLVHGFIVERWCEDAQPLAADDVPVEDVAHYIGSRARVFPAEGANGASIDELLTMCRRNLSLSLGEEAARALDGWQVARLSRRISRVRTDNKLDRSEWLRATGGRLVKVDAVDHHQAHDLIGCQDLAWDVAGAIVEFDLTGREADRLIAISEQMAARHVNRELLNFYRLAYCCFRLGHAELASQMCGERAERERLNRCADRYASAGRRLLHQHDCCGTRQESLVG